MRILISGGGTGGHVYPALAVATQLKTVLHHPEVHLQDVAPGKSAHRSEAVALVDIRTTDHEMELLWAGSSDGVERTLVQEAGIPYHAVQTGQLRGKNPLTLLANVGKMVVGIRQSLDLLDEFQPKVCLVTGGYVCAPVAVACRLRGVPVLVYLPDMTPGLAVRLLSYLSRGVAVSFPEVIAYFGRKTIVTGYPVRTELLDAVADREAARRQLAERTGIDWSQTDEWGRPLPLLLVFGGSRGARSINQSIWAALPKLLLDGQILHITGERDWPMLEEQAPDLPGALARRYYPVAYLHQEMAWALAAADLVVARAGASTLGEFPVARLPAILVPLPIAGNHQMPNAAKLADAGGAEIVLDEALTQELAPRIIDLLRDESRRLKMGAAMAALARPRAAYNIAQELLRLGGNGVSTLGDPVKSTE